MKVIVTTGGTGGHIFPALALMEKIKSESTLNKIKFIGTIDRLDATLIPEKGYDFVGLDVHAFSKNIKSNIKNAKDIISSYKKVKKILKEEKPDIVIGFGGYVTFPVLLAASRLKIKVVMHEQNVIPGKVNKVLQKYAETIFVSFKESKEYLKKVRVIYSGNPTGIRAFNIKKHDKTTLGFGKNKKLIIIVMGSLGSSTVNSKMVEFLRTFNDNDKEVLFIGGKHYYENTLKNINLPKNVKVMEFYNDLPALMKDADLLITRAGASTLAEVLSIKIPSIIIPSPYVANNHQYYNALDLEKNALGIMIEEKDLTVENIKTKISYLLDNKKNYQEIKENLNKVTVLDSCDIMYKEMEKIIRNK